ncbi:DUF6924 domain-containing protein [Spirillospora sp. CA-253888]
MLRKHDKTTTELHRRKAMSYPKLPRPAPGEVLLVCTRYRDDTPLWGDLFNEVGGRREGDVLLVEGDGVRFRLVEGRSWDFLHGGSMPARVPADAPPSPVVVLADGSVAYGGYGPLLVDMAVIPGRGVRVHTARLSEILSALLDGALTFDDLVRDMDLCGVYQGDRGRPAFPAPTTVSKRNFPALPSTGATLLVRTSFDDEEGWRALLAQLGEDQQAWNGADLDEVDVEHPALEAWAVDDRAFEGLQPGQVPALVPPNEHTTMVALADARTFAEPGWPLTVVDLYDIPGQPAVVPYREVGSMACNLELGNMDFRDFIVEKDTEPWWDED